MAAVHVFGDGAGDGLREAGPAAAGVELGVGREQLGIAANAVVAAVGPVLFVFAGVGALGGGVACDLVGAGFGAFFLQHGMPLRVGFLDGEAHDEQLMAMDEAHSGANPAHCACSGWSS
ncbi:hypothetical protein D3C80_1703690 [compost metagenome]